MAEFRQLIIAPKGKALMAKIMLGTGSVKFTKIATSTAIYTDTQLIALEVLENIKQTVNVTKITRSNAVTVQVEGAVDNRTITTGYQMNTVGLYAIDPDEGEILFAACVAATAGYMPPYNGLTVSGAFFKLVTSVGSSENITLEVDPAGYASIGDVRDLQQQIDEIIEIKMPTKANVTDFNDHVNNRNVHITSAYTQNLGQQLAAKANLADFTTQKNDGEIHITSDYTAKLQNYNNLTNKPTSLLANGGNADTIDGKHATDFMPLVKGNDSDIVDLDTLGSTQVITGTFTNYPKVCIDGQGSVIVLRYISGWIRQFFISPHENSMYVRVKIGYGTTWSEWDSFVGKIDFDTYKKNLNNKLETKADITDWKLLPLLCDSGSKIYYKKIDKLVCIKGVVIWNSTQNLPQTIAVLPEGFRPNPRVIMLAMKRGVYETTGFMSFSIETDGTMSIVASSTDPQIVTQNGGLDITISFSIN